MKKSLALLAVLGVLQVACSTDTPKSQNADTTKSSATQTKVVDDTQQSDNTQTTDTTTSQSLDHTQTPEFKQMVAEIRVKLQKDEKRVFEDFAFLALSQCFDIMLPYTYSMANMHNNGFNAGNEIFPRLMTVDNLEKELIAFHEKNFPKKDYYSFFEIVKSCQDFYHIDNPLLKEKYYEIINNPKYLADWQETREDN